MWKERFPDPSMSPAHYAKVLTICCSQTITAVNVDVGDWIRGFSSVVHLEVGNHNDLRKSVISLVPLHEAYSIITESSWLDSPIM